VQHRAVTYSYTGRAHQDPVL